jgi:hypothetical protein
MRRHHRIAGTIDILKSDTQSNISIDDCLDTAGTIDAPLFVDKLSTQFLYTENIGQRSWCVGRHKRTRIVCLGSRRASHGNKLRPGQPPVPETTFGVSTLLK